MSVECLQPCKGFIKAFGRQIALNAKNFEDQAVYLDRVKRRRKWREDYWHSLVDVFLAILYAPLLLCTRVLLPLIRLLGIAMAHVICFICLGWFLFALVSAGCYEANYGDCPLDSDEAGQYNVGYFLVTFPKEFVEKIFSKDQQICKNPWIEARVDSMRKRSTTTYLSKEGFSIDTKITPGICLDDPGGPIGPTGPSN